MAEMRASLILAQRVLDMLEECGATKPEREAAIDAVATLIRQEHYEPLEPDPHGADDSLCQDDQPPL
jgi:hypothetical protein